MLLFFSRFSIQEVLTIFKPLSPVKWQLMNTWGIRVMLYTGSFLSTVQRTSLKFS